MNALDVERLQAGYGPITVLHDVSLGLREGQFGAMLGPNGAGKSTLLLAIAGLLPIRRGAVRLYSSDVTREPGHRRARRGLSLVSEQLNLFPSMTVRENLLVGAHRCTDKQALQRRLTSTLDLFPRLAERSKQLAGTLSGGERRMLAIARALMSEPRILLIDEPSNGLAPSVVDDVFVAIADLKHKGITILLVEQHVKRALELADVAWVIERGEIRLEGCAADLQHHSYIREVYLGSR